MVPNPKIKFNTACNSSESSNGKRGDPSGDRRSETSADKVQQPAPQMCLKLLPTKQQSSPSKYSKHRFTSTMRHSERKNSLDEGAMSHRQDSEAAPMSEQPSCQSSDLVKTDIKSDYPVEQSDENMESFVEQTTSLDPEGINTSLNKELENVKRGEILGEGTFGKVYQGLYNGSNSRIPPRMAIKVVQAKDKSLLKRLYHECELLKTLDHPCIVKYYGCVMNESENEASIFMELMPHSLQSSY